MAEVVPALSHVNNVGPLRIQFSPIHNSSSLNGVEVGCSSALEQPKYVSDSASGNVYRVGRFKRSFQNP